MLTADIFTQWTPIKIYPNLFQLPCSHPLLCKYQLVAASQGLGQRWPPHQVMFTDPKYRSQGGRLLRSPAFPQIGLFLIISSRVKQYCPTLNVHRQTEFKDGQHELAAPCALVTINSLLKQFIGEYLNTHYHWCTVRVIYLSTLLFFTTDTVINKLLSMQIAYKSKAKPVVINDRPVVKKYSCVN